MRAFRTAQVAECHGDLRLCEHVRSPLLLLAIDNQAALHRHDLEHHAFRLYEGQSPRNNHRIIILRIPNAQR